MAKLADLDIEIPSATLRDALIRIDAQPSFPLSGIRIDSDVNDVTRVILRAPVGAIRIRGKAEVQVQVLLEDLEVDAIAPTLADALEALAAIVRESGKDL